MTINGTRPEPLRGKRVAILGFARQGMALARWLPKIGAKAVVSDSKTAAQLNIVPDDWPGVEFRLGSQDETLLDDVEMLCISGGVPLALPVVQEAVRRGIPLSNDAQLFLERCPAPVLGITGSAGKTTTTTLVGEIARAAGYRTWVGGNIGDVLLDVLDEIQPGDCVVMELSSFQLEIMTASPTVSAVLNITPNHLDRHGTMEAYTEAKAQILAHQSPEDMAVLSYDDAGSRELESRVAGRLGWFSMRDIVADGAFMAGQRLLVTGLASADATPRVVMERSEIGLRGDHNVLNVLAACAITGVFGVETDAMRSAVSAFRGVAHRLEVVRAVNDVTYINDSIATAPERVVAALHSFREPLVLLLGGRDKNLPWDDMLKLALHKARHIVTFGEAGEMVAKRLEDLFAPPEQVTRVATLEEAIRCAVGVAQAGDVVLLSPGGTSYDAYADFAARGEHFRALVNAL